MSTHKVPLYCCWLPPNTHYGRGDLTVITVRYDMSVNPWEWQLTSAVSMPKTVCCQNLRRKIFSKHRRWVVASAQRWTMLLSIYIFRIVIKLRVVIPLYVCVCLCVFSTTKIKLKVYQLIKTLSLSPIFSFATFPCLK